MEAKKKKKNSGNPFIVLRVSPELLAWIDEAVSKCNETRRAEPYDRSSFVRACIFERKEKYVRAKKSAQKKGERKAALVPVPVAEPVAGV